MCEYGKVYGEHWRGPYTVMSEGKKFKVISRTLVHWLYTDIVYNCGIRFITRNNLRTLTEAESRADNIIVRGERQDVLPKTRVYGIIEFDILRINGPAITQKPRSNAVIFSLKEIERFNARTTRRPNIIIATVHCTIYRFVHRRIHPIGPIYNI